MKKPQTRTTDIGRPYAAPSCEAFQLDLEAHVMITASSEDVEEDNLDW